MEGYHNLSSDNWDKIFTDWFRKCSSSDVSRVFQTSYTGLGTQTSCQNLRMIDAKQTKPFNHIFNGNTSTCSQTFNLSKTFYNVELKALCMSGSKFCLNISQCIVCINESNICVALVYSN